MAKTSLTVGGFSQPAVTRSLIEVPGNAERGLTQRILWLYPRPVYSSFSTLERIDKSFVDNIGKFIILLITCICIMYYSKHSRWFMERY